MAAEFLISRTNPGPLVLPKSAPVVPTSEKLLTVLPPGTYQISGLSAATVYAIEVAAVNSAGTGDYSDPLTAETPESKCTYLHVLWNGMNIYLIDLLTLQVCTSV